MGSIPKENNISFFVHKVLDGHAIWRGQKEFIFSFLCYRPGRVIHAQGVSSKSIQFVHNGLVEVTRPLNPYF